MEHINSSISNDPTEAETKYIVFSINSGIYAIEARFVRKVTNVLHITPQPRTAPHILGAASVDGTVYTVVDLRVLFGMAVETVSPPSVAVLIAYRNAKICAVVDRVISVAGRAPDQKAQLFNVSPWITGIIQIDGKDVNLLSVDDLLGMDKAAFSGFRSGAGANS